MWEARAVYSDGTTVERLFAYNWNETDRNQVYSIECWLKNRHQGLIWMSVTHIVLED